MEVPMLSVPSHSGEESSELTSFPSSASDPSLESKAESRAPRAKATYSRKANATHPAEESFANNTIRAASSSLPSSPTEQCFDTPMRAYGRNARKDAHEDMNEEDAAELTVNTDVSPGSQPDQVTVKAKYGRTSRALRVGSTPPQTEISDEDELAPRTKKFHFGLSKTIYDSGSDGEAGPQADHSSSREPSVELSGSRSASQPPLNNDDEPVAPRRGRISLMRGKNGKVSRSRFSSGEEEGDNSEDPESRYGRKDRAFKLLSSSGSGPDNGPTPSRRDKMEALAAKARSQMQSEQENVAADSMVDEFLTRGRASPSASPIIPGSDDDDHDDAMPTFRNGKKVGPGAKSKPKTKAKAKRASPDILSNLEEKAPKAKHSKAKAPPAIKPPSKKVQETMHRETARLDREHRARLAPAPKKQINLQDLLHRISSSKPDGSASASPAPESGFVSSDPPSSLIPSAQSRSQHRSSQLRSDPIESDPIRDRSSPSHLSSPVVAMTKQQERRLGFNTDPNVATPTSGLAMMKHDSIVDVGEDDSDEDLPELGDMLEDTRRKKETEEKYAAFKARKLKALELEKQKKPQQDQDVELDVYQPASASARSQNRLSMTPGPKRPADQMYQNLGMKTTPGRTAYRGTNAAGSPNGADMSHADDDDDLVVTDSQLRANGKTFAVASDKAAGKTQPEDVHAGHTNTPSVEKPRQTSKAGPSQLTTAEFNATLNQRVNAQARQARALKEAKARASGASRTLQLDDDDENTNNNDIQAMIENLAAQQALGDDEKEDEVQNSDEEHDSDFQIADDQDAGSVVDSDVEILEMGSASEGEAVAEDDDVEPIDFSGDERPQAQGLEDDAQDSEKENAPPPSSQQSQHSRTVMASSPNLVRSIPPSRALMDDDEDEVARPRIHARRMRPSAVVDDEEDGIEGSSHSHAVVPGHNADASQSQDRIPLGDISSQSIGHLATFSRSNSSSPAARHAAPPAHAHRPDKVIFSGAAGEDEDSFCTNDIPSDAGNGLSQFFAPTMPAPTSKPALFASTHQQRSYWDQTQNSTQSQSQQQGTQRRGLVRDDSANSALGAFFNDTQQESLRGESLDVFENHKVPGGKAIGFTQHYNDGTPSAKPAGALDGGATLGSVWDASSMPPPKSKDVDAFAALRRAQMGEALELLAPTPSVLPTLDESQAEREAYALANIDGRANGPASPEKMYLNNEGFFTQTKPVGTQAQWTQYDSQSQSQGQDPTFSSLRQSPASLLRDSRNPFVVSPAPVPSRTVSRNHEDQGLSDEESEVVPVQRKLKRLRRGAVESEPENEHDDVVAEDDNEVPPSSQNSVRSRNAFDVLQSRSVLHSNDNGGDKPKVRKSAFIEGEAEESDDEELNGNRDAGGLHGVFADEGGNPAGSGDEDDEDDADASDMEDLVDNQKELDEAEKDRLVHAQYLADRAEQDKKDLELHQRAVQGVLRSRRGRGAGLGGMDDILDDEADDEDLRRRAMMAPGARAWKKRKVDGEEDGMDALAANEDAKAFVQGYQDTHMVDHELDRYDFLVAPIDPNDKDSEDDEESDANEDAELADADRDEANAADDIGEEDVFGPTKSVATITNDQLRSEIRERRNARRRDRIEDDEEGDPQVTEVTKAKRGNNWDSDEDDAAESVAMRLRDRTKGANNAGLRAADTKNAAARKKAPQGRQYGRQIAKKGTHAEDTNENEHVPDQDNEDDNDDDQGHISLLERLARSAAKTRPRFGAQNEPLEDAEPEWGNDANIVRAPRPSTTSGSQKTKPSSSSRLSSSTNAAPKRMATRNTSMMLGKQSIMRRESGFSSSSGQ